MPMEHFVNSLIKVAESPSSYIVDFIYTIKMSQSDLYQLYIDPIFFLHKHEFNTL